MFLLVSAGGKAGHHSGEAWNAPGTTNGLRPAPRHATIVRMGSTHWKIAPKSNLRDRTNTHNTLDQRLILSGPNADMPAEAAELRIPQK